MCTFFLINLTILKFVIMKLPVRLKLEKLVLLPHGPAMLLIKKFYYNSPIADKSIFDVITMSKHCRKYSCIGAYCSIIIKLRNSISHVHHENEITDRYQKFVKIVRITSFIEEEYIMLFNRVIKKVNKINNMLNSGYDTIPYLEYINKSGLIPGIYTLEYCKQKWRYEVKYEQMLVIDGKNIGESVKLIGWNGTNATLVLSSGQKISASIEYYCTDIRS